MFFIGAWNRRVSSGFHAPKSFFIGAHGQELSVPRHSTLIQPSLWCPEIQGSVAHLVHILELLWARFKHLLEVCRMMNLRPLLACNWGQYLTFPASDVWSETMHTLARKAALTRIPRKIRLPYSPASYLRERFEHLFDVVWWIWDHFWHAIRSNTLHFRPRNDDTKKMIS